MARLRQLKNTHQGETCVIIGNGPSLKNTPLEALGDKYFTLGSNKIYLYPFYPDFWACVDKHMVHDCVPYVLAHQEEFSHYALPRDIPAPGAIGLNVVIKPYFSLNPEHEVILGGTVSFVLMQIAYYMGFQRALLVGMDHSYPGVADRGRPGSTFVGAGDDTSHFHPDYFESGKIYARPELDAVALYTYPMAKMAWAQDSREIINCSAETALDVFPVKDVKEFI